MSHAFWLLLETLGSLLAAACVLRAYMSWLGLGARDPLGQFIIAVTDWIVRPLRAMFPSSRRNVRSVDWASLVAALLLAVVLAILFVVLMGAISAPAFGVVILLAVFWLVKWSLWLLTALVLLLAILSWINPHAPIAPTIDTLTRPFLAPIRRVIPLIGGVDLSPLVLILLAQLALTMVQSVMPAVFAAVS